MNTDPCLNYSFLRDPKTIAHIKQSKVMFIMRGLPGSGKSVIADVIRETYLNSIICSADDFRMVDGQYVFVQADLQAVHEKCQACAKDACEKGINVVIIDNTNVRSWEMKFYVSLANQANYTVVLVEPKTAWRFNALELAMKNKHNVSIDVLQKKVISFEHVMPQFFGWFLNYQDSARIRDISRKFYHELQHIPEFREQFKMCVVGDPNARLNFDDYFSSETFSTGSHMLHCTAMFCGRGKVPESYEYANKDVVRKSIGKAFTLHFIGFFITSRTFGVRIKLTPQEITLWGQEDKLEIANRKEAQIALQMKARGWRPRQGGVANSNSTEFDDLCDSSDSDSIDMEQYNSSLVLNYRPTSGVGSRAHMTLGCAAGVSAVQTGLDLVNIIQLEKKAAETRDTDVTQINLDGATLRCYDNKAWVVYLNEMISADTLFTGFY
ncbi:2',3'-cyclic-nucleotide 3'-phosphodiesterase-like [Saccoglossus kowalevskii]